MGLAVSWLDWIMPSFVQNACEMFTVDSTVFRVVRSRTLWCLAVLWLLLI